MLYAAIACLSLALILGLMIIMHVLSDKKVPRFLIFTHGPMAVIGLILVVIYALAYTSAAPLVVIICLFVIVATAGFFLFYEDLTGRPVSKWMAFGHGLLALATFLFLVIYTVVNT